MSKNSLPPKSCDNSDWEALTAMLGGQPPTLQRDYDEEAVQMMINHLRGLLGEAVTKERIRPAELSRRMRVHRSLVTRFFRSKGDMKVSTLALIARAIGYKWAIDLVKCEARDRPNYTPQLDVRPTAWENSTRGEEENLTESGVMEWKQLA